jgi:hypothetical protein
VLFHSLQPVLKQRILYSVLNQISCEMSTAVVASDRVSVPALGVEGSKEIAVVTPDVIEVRRSFRSHSHKTDENPAPLSIYRNPSPPNQPATSRQVQSKPPSIPLSANPHPILLLQSTDNLAPSAPVVGETATTPALEHAESAIPTTESSSVVKPAVEEKSTPIVDSTVIKSAVTEGSAVPVKDDAPVAGDGLVKAPTDVAPIDGAKDKDVKEVKAEKKDKIKKQDKKACHHQ